MSFLLSLEYYLLDATRRGNEVTLNRSGMPALSMPALSLGDLMAATVCMVSKSVFIGRRHMQQDTCYECHLHTFPLISLLCNRLQVEIGLPFKAPRGLTVHMLHLEDLY